MNTEITAGIIRHILSGVGAYLVSRGFVDNAAMESILGGIMALYAVVWSIGNKTGRGTPMPPGGLAAFLMATAAAVWLAGCATYHSTVTRPDGSKVETTVRTFCDSKSQLAKSSCSQGTSTNRQSVALSGLDQESQSTAVTTLIQSITEGITKGMKP